MEIKVDVALYLDDFRTPRQNMYKDWVIVRSFSEFTKWIDRNGLPDFITFDHDLADEHYSPDTFNLSAEEWAVHEFVEKTGFDAAKWLIDYCLDNDCLLPKFTVHSANPAGAQNILSLLNNFRKHQGLSPDGYRTVW